MQVEVRLFASLERRAGPRRAGEPYGVELPAAATLEDLLAALGLTRPEVHLVLVNGQAVNDPSRALSPGDRIGLFPPVGGG